MKYDNINLKGDDSKINRSNNAQNKFIVFFSIYG